MRQTFKQIVGNTDEGVFLDERLSVFADEGKPVHVRIHTDAEVRLFAYDGAAQLLEVFRERLRIVGKFTGRIAVELYAFHSQPFEKTRHDDASDGIDGVHDNLETGLAYSLGINGFQCKYGIDVLVREITLLHLSELIDRGEIEMLLLRAVKDCLSLGGRKELTVFIEKLKGIPLARIV